MGNCLVTKLKGTVQNPNLPFLGELNLRLLYSDIENYRIFFIYNHGTEPVDYIVTGVDALKDGLGNTIPLQGQVPANTEVRFNYTINDHSAEGHAKIHARYECGFSMGSRVLIADISECYTDKNGSNFKLEHDTGGNIFDRIEGPVTMHQYRNFDLSIPMSLNLADMHNVSIAANEGVSLPNVKIAGRDELNNLKKYDFKGDLINLMSIGGLSDLYAQVIDLSFSAAGNAYVSNFAAFAPLTNVARINMQGVLCSGDVIGTLSNWNKVVFFCFNRNTETDWTALFNAWKSAYAGKTVEFGGTVGTVTNPATGDTVQMKNYVSVVFDAQGNWTLTPGS